MKGEFFLNNAVIENNQVLRLEFGFSSDNIKNDQISEKIDGIYIEHNNIVYCLSELKYENENFFCEIPFLTFEKIKKICTEAKLLIKINIDDMEKKLNIYLNGGLQDKYIKTQLNTSEFLYIDFDKEDRLMFKITNQIKFTFDSKLSEIYFSNNKLFINSEIYFINEIEYLENEIEILIKSRKSGKENVIYTTKALKSIENYDITVDFEKIGKKLTKELGVWDFFVRIKINQNTYNHRLKLDRNIFNEIKNIIYDGASHIFSKVYMTADGNLALYINNNLKQLFINDMRNIEFNNNIIKLTGNIYFDICEIDQLYIKKFVLINRKTKEEYSYIVNKKCDRYEQNEYNIDLKDNYECGILDIFVKFLFHDKEIDFRLNFKDNKIISDFVVFPITVINRKEQILRIRPYLTADNNLAVLVKDNILKCNISNIICTDGVIKLNGEIGLLGLDTNFNIEKIIARKEDNNEIINSIEFNIKKQEKLNETMKTFVAIVNFNNFKVKDKYEGFYNMYILININNIYKEFKLVSNLDDINNKNHAFKYPKINLDNNELFNAEIYYNVCNELKINISNCLKVIGNKIKIHKDYAEIYGHFNIADKNIKECNILLIDKFSKETIEIPVNNIIEDKFNVKIKFTQNVRYIKERQSDVYFVLNVNNKKIMAPIMFVDEQYIKENCTFKKNIVKQSKEHYFSAYICSKTRKLQLEIRQLKEIEKKSSKVKFKLAKVLSKCIKPFFTNEIWFVGENLAEVAQDNGFAFFEYCMEYNIPEKVYYITKSNNKNYSRLVKYKDNLIMYDSFKHMLYYHLADYLIVSHGIRDVIPGVIHNKIGKNLKPIIYLQHGIVAMKKIFFNTNSYNGQIKKFVVSSEHEKNIFLNHMNFSENQLIVTGLARFDKLNDNSHKKEKKEIIIMPTWRDWLLNSESEFLNSEFYKYYTGLLRDKRLHKMIEDNNLIIKFYPHIEIQKKYLHHFQSIHENIIIVDPKKENVQQLIYNSSLMITDYSSVALDFNYIKKPIIFYQFDLPEYLRYRGAYVDLKKELPGEICENIDELLKHLKKYISNNFSYEKEFELKSKKYYEYCDRNNNERIYSEIKNLKR